MSSLREMEEDRERSLAALMSLDREWAAGEIDEFSYRELRDDYVAQAAAAIRALAVGTVPEPVGTVPEPVGTVPEPVGTVPEPVGTVPEPVGTVPEPVGTLPEPVGTLPEPVGTGQPDWVRPASYSNDRPSQIGADPGIVEPDAALQEATVALDPSGSARPRRVRVRRRWMLGGSILAFMVGIGIGVGSFAAARQPGQQVSGSPPVLPAPSSHQLSTQVAAELLQARTLVSKGSDVAAAKILAKVLNADPNQPVALAYEGWVLRLAGVSAHNAADMAQGRALVAEATALDPSYPDAHVFLGYMYFQDLQNTNAAVTQFKMFLDDHPLPALVKRTAGVIAQAYAAGHQAVPAQVAADLKVKGG